MNERTHRLQPIPDVNTPVATRIACELIALVLAASTALYGCGDESSEATYLARYEPAPCDFKLPDGQTLETVECGHLIVPEDRSRNDGRTVTLAVAVLKATGAAPASDPLVFLSGGPGGRLLEAGMQLYTPEFAAPLQSKRDLVFFDQRGTGRSQPKLDCPENVESFLAGLPLDLTAEEEAARQLSANRACHDRLVADGVNLSAYRSAVSAADLQDLMTALGYERWNIHGTSYGTRLALTAMRDTPEHIRSVILDSTVPVQEPLDANFAADFEHALNVLFAGCASDPACGAAFPDLEQNYGEQAAQTLPRSHFFEFPGFGHGQLRALSAETARPRCAMQLVGAFLDDPLSEPDGSCVETLEAPRFVGR